MFRYCDIASLGWKNCRVESPGSPRGRTAGEWRESLFAATAGHGNIAARTSVRSIEQAKGTRSWGCHLITPWPSGLRVLRSYLLLPLLSAYCVLGSQEMSQGFRGSNLPSRGMGRSRYRSNCPRLALPNMSVSRPECRSLSPRHVNAVTVSTDTGRTIG